MILEEKKFLFSKEIEGKDVNVFINGKDTGITLKHLIKNLEVDEDEAVGYSALQYFTLKEGVLIDHEGKVLTFVMDGETIMLQKMKDPLISGEIEIGSKYIQDLSEVLKIQPIEQFGKNLSSKEFAELVVIEEEKEAKVKEVKEKEVKEKEEQKKKCTCGKTKDENGFCDGSHAVKEEEEEAAAPEIPQGEQYITPKNFKLLVRRLQRIGFKEYKKDKHTLFYGEDAPDNEVPKMIVDRDLYFEILEGSLISEDPIEYEFTDLDGNDKIAIVENNRLIISEL